MRRLALLAALALSGCAAATSEPAVRGTSAYVCKGDALGRFTGQTATQQLGAEMQRVSGAGRLQWVGPGMMVTMDFSPQRLRVFLTADNKVDRATCG